MVSFDSCLFFSCCLFSEPFYFYTVLSAALAAFEHPEDKSAPSLQNQVPTRAWLFGSGSPPDLISYGKDCGLLWEHIRNVSEEVCGCSSSRAQILKDPKSD